MVSSLIIELKLLVVFSSLAVSFSFSLYLDMSSL